MRAVLPTVAALLTGVALLMTGQGLLGTLLAVRLGREGVGPGAVSVVMAVFFAGLALGAVATPRVVQRVGHIRAFAAFAGLVGAVVLLHALVPGAVAWAALRGVNGVCVAGLLVVTESWLNARADDASRGRILSLYMAAYYLSLGAGQLLLGLADPAELRLFLVAALLVVGGLVPVALTRAEAPLPPRPAPMNLGGLGRRAPAAIAGAFGAGAVNGSVLALGPAFAAGLGLETRGIAALMGVTIIGGLLLQWPAGRLSDTFDRRTVLATLALALAPASLLLWLLSGLGPLALGLGAAVFGGLAATGYPLALAHAVDRVEGDEAVAANSAMVLISGAGSVAGPLAAGLAMRALGPWGLFAFAGGVGAAVGLFTLGRMGVRAPLPPEEQGPYVAVPCTTPVVGGLDPRAEGEAG